MSFLAKNDEVSDPCSMEKKFLSFFGLFFYSESLKSKIKKFWKKIFFEKFGQKIAYWPQISTQKARFGQKYFFRDPEAPRFPTRGHMPMFEKIRFFGPETDRRARILENRSFRTKSVSVSFLQFWFPNFLPKISKILRAIFQKNFDLCHFWVIFGYFEPFWDR